MYDPRVGIWLNLDPIGFDAGDANPNRYVGNGPTNATDPVGLRETDDRLTSLTMSLADVSGILEANVNAQIQRSWAMAHHTAQVKVGYPRSGSDDYTRKAAKDLVYYVYYAFGADQPGSTVHTFGPIAKIGWLLDNQWLGSESNQLFRIKFGQSRYLLNQNPSMHPLKNPWLFDEKTRNHGLAAVIRIKDVLVGTDKWEHFFQQGYWLWDLAYGPGKQRLERRYGMTILPDFTDLAVRTAFSEWLEGTDKTRAHVSDPLVAKYDREFAHIASFYGIKGVKGVYGSYSTGVISFADICANEQGFQFHSGLYKAFLQNSSSRTPTFTFDVDNYDIFNMNEQNNPNTFLNGVIVNDGLDVPIH